ncbi:hypothetical protein [Arthrobacter sp. 3Tela_A]|uniref:hypothetical protein n=1 Tax=Arthrobacter sp. 3Tela_A TaxID=3093743 RepID=UPI003BB778DF
MGLLEIELAKLDYAERMQSAEYLRREQRRKDLLPRTAGRTRRAKVDAPVFTLRIGSIRYRLWFTRTVAL